MDFFYIPWLSDSIKKEENNDDCTSKEQATHDVASTVFHLPPNITLDVKPLYKLTFFNARGGAETTRMMLIYLQIPFIDKRIVFAEFMKKQDDLIFRQLPLLELQGGEIICHSAAIARFIAKEYGLFGTTNLEQARADEIVDNIIGLVNGIKEYAIYKVRNGYSTSLETTIELNFVTKNAQQGLKRFLPQLEMACSGALANKHGFILPSGLTYADFNVATTYETVCEYFPSQTNQFKALQHVRNKVYALPQLQYYLKTRPKTVF